MPTIDLGTTATSPDAGSVLTLSTRDAFDALPRRVALTLPELLLVAERAGDAPLPFDVAVGESASGLEGRLGTSPASTEDAAWADTVAGLHDPTTTLTRRGLLDDGVVDAGLAGAVGLLATPEVAVDLDLVVDAVHVRAWHRQSGDAVAALATADGVAFELAWLAASSWPEELARVTALPEGHPIGQSAVPAGVSLPYELADAAAEAGGSGRTDLLEALAQRHDGAVLDGAGQPLDPSEVTRLLAGLGVEPRGRLRVLVARVGDERTHAVGVRSWTLLADGWRSVHPVRTGGRTTVTLQPVQPVDLAVDLAPVLSEALA